MTAALQLITPYLTSTEGAAKLEAYRLYAAAKMQQAGVDAIEVVSAAAFNGTSGDAGGDGRKDTIAILRNAFPGLASTEGSVAKEALADAISKLKSMTGDDDDDLPPDSDFTAAPARVQNGLRYQLGLAHFFQALRITLKTSGLLENETFDPAVCATVLGASGELNGEDGLSGNLGDSRSSFLAASLDASNPLVELVTDLRQSVDDNGDNISIASEVCNYINQQNAAAQSE